MNLSRRALLIGPLSICHVQARAGILDTGNSEADLREGMLKTRKNTARLTKIDPLKMTWDTCNTAMLALHAPRSDNVNGEKVMI